MNIRDLFLPKSWRGADPTPPLLTNDEANGIYIFAMLTVLQDYRDLTKGRDNFFADFSRLLRVVNSDINVIKQGQFSYNIVTGEVTFEDGKKYGNGENCLTV